jgi:hypothetical protein
MLNIHETSDLKRTSSHWQAVFIHRLQPSLLRQFFALRMIRNSVVR